MYVRLPVALHAAVKADADRNERTMAQTIRYALRRHLDSTDWRAIALALFDNAHRSDAEYFLTDEQRQACRTALSGSDIGSSVPQGHGEE